VSETSAGKRIYIKLQLRRGLLEFVMLDPTAGESLRFGYLYADAVQGQVLPYDISRIVERVREAMPRDIKFDRPDRELMCVYTHVDARQPLWAVGIDHGQQIGIRSGSGKLVTGPDRLAEFNPALSAEESGVDACVSLDEALPGAFRRAFGLN
jgi:hypothetical protein